MQPVESDVRERGALAHQPDAIEAWAQRLPGRFVGRITIALALVKESVAPLHTLMETAWWSDPTAKIAPPHQGAVRKKALPLFTNDSPTQPG